MKNIEKKEPMIKESETASKGLGLWGRIVRTTYYALLAALSLFVIAAITLSASAVRIEPYVPNYELTIIKPASTVKYTCDTFVINGNEYQLFDTNRVRTNLVVIPSSLIVDIKTMKKD